MTSPARRTGNRTLDKQQVALRVHADDLKTLHGHVGGTHVAGHLLALEHAARGLALADGARRAVRQGVAVGRVLRAEVPALDRALEALALGATGTSTFCPASKRSTVSSAPTSMAHRRRIAQTELPQATTRLDTRLGEVPASDLLTLAALRLPAVT
jgi:hypothetical protein